MGAGARPINSTAPPRFWFYVSALEVSLHIAECCLTKWLTRDLLKIWIPSRDPPGAEPCCPVDFTAARRRWDSGFTHHPALAATGNLGTRTLPRIVLLAYEIGPHIFR